MTTFEITFEKNGIYHANLATAANAESVRKWYKENKPNVEIVAIKEATSDSMKPGKPHITIEEPADVVEMVNVSDLAEDLDTGDYGDRLNDYRDSDAYICDAISEIADADTSIYYSDILAFIKENPEALADVVAEGLYEVTGGAEYDLYKHGQAAEYLTIQRDLYEHMRDALMLCAVDFIRYDLKRDTIPAELAELLEEWADEADNNDRMNEIPDKIRDYYESLEGEE